MFSLFTFLIEIDVDPSKFRNADSFGALAQIQRRIPSQKMQKCYARRSLGKII